MRTSVNSRSGARTLAQGVERIARALEAVDRVAGLAQRGGEHEAHAAVVVDHPDARGVTGGHGRRSSSGIGSSSVNTVCPGRERYASEPRCSRATCCASARPRPLPSARPLTSGRNTLLGQFLRHAAPVVDDLQPQRQRDAAASPMRTPCSARVRRVTFAAPASIALRTRFHTAWVRRSASPTSSGRLGS